jgi:hypothetical protein
MGRAALGGGGKVCIIKPEGRRRPELLNAQPDTRQLFAYFLFSIQS